MAGPYSPIDNFPITEDEVRKYFPVECDCCPRGKLQKESTNHHNFQKPNHTSKEPRNTEHHDAQMRNNIIGHEIGIDYYSYLDKKKINVRDKASGYAMDIDIKSKKYAPEAIEMIIEEFAKNGHHTPQMHKPINILKKDNEVTLRTTEVNKILHRNGIQPENSPPYEHKYNGLIESDTKTTAATTIASLECAPHLPRSTWNYIYSLAHITNNMRPTLRPEFKKMRTRYEDFHHSRPNMWTKPLLPAGQPVNFSLDKTRQLETVCHVGAYLGPSDETPGSIRILDMETGHYVDTTNYKVLNYMPSAFTRIHPEVWKSTNPINDKGEVKYDLHY